MGKTLDEFINKYSAVQKLQSNLKVSLDAFLENVPEEEKQTLLRLHMVMVRQCLQDFGAE